MTHLAATNYRGRPWGRRNKSRWATSNAMMKRIGLPLLLLIAIVASGCVYRASISQGNLVKQEDLDQVTVGMTRNQVRFLLGTPLIDDPFHADRWDYVYYLKVGRNDAAFERWVTILFSNDRVSEIRKDQDLAEDL
jgi:outer membrane protein assembly factor BamE